MARTQLSVQTIPKNTELDDVSFTAGDAANNHYWINSGKELLLMKSTNGSLPAIVQSVADEHGREGDVTLTPGAGETSVAGPFDPAIFNQRGSSDLGNIHLDIADATNVTFAVVKYSI